MIDIKQNENGQDDKQIWRAFQVLCKQKKLI